MSLLKKHKKVDRDLHDLVGQVLDGRLRVIRLAYVSPRQWLYEVEPPSVGKTRRALKVLGDPAGREPGSFYRLRTTCDRLRALESPYVEQVYEAGTLHDLTPYLLTEWEPHTSLYEYLRRRRKPLSWDEAQPLLIEIGEGLKALHDRGVTHGDLRAHHVLLRQPPTGAILIDYGTSVAFGSPPMPGLDKSFAYWAPERLTFAAATPSTDLYSFGVLAYLCLTGHLPFEPTFEETVDASQDDDQDHPRLDPQFYLTVLHRERLAPRLSGQAPPYIEDLIASLLAKEEQKRPSNAEEVLNVLKGNRVSINIEEDPQATVDLPTPVVGDEGTPKEPTHDSSWSAPPHFDTDPIPTSWRSVAFLSVLSTLCVIIGAVIARSLA